MFCIVTIIEVDRVCGIPIISVCQFVGHRQSVSVSLVGFHLLVAVGCECQHWDDGWCLVSTEKGSKFSSISSSFHSTFPLSPLVRAFSLFVIRFWRITISIVQRLGAFRFLLFYRRRHWHNKPQINPFIVIDGGWWCVFLFLFSFVCLNPRK